MGLKRVSWVRRYQGQCRALRPLGHQGYRLRNHKKDQPPCSGYTDMPLPSQPPWAQRVPLSFCLCLFVFVCLLNTRTCPAPSLPFIEPWTAVSGKCTFTLIRMPICQFTTTPAGKQAPTPRPKSLSMVGSETGCIECIHCKPCTHTYMLLCTHTCGNFLCMLSLLFLPIPFVVLPKKLLVSFADKKDHAPCTHCP